MLYVISYEMVPESHSHGFEQAATASFMTDFLLMTVLNYLGSGIRVRDYKDRVIMSDSFTGRFAELAYPWT